MMRHMILLLAVTRWCTVAIPYYDLNRYCATINQPIILPCGANDEGRVGTMEWNIQPAGQNCSITVAIDPSTCPSWQTRKLYINVKGLRSMPMGDSLSIYETAISYYNELLTERALLRTVTWSEPCRSSPSSCSHVLSRKMDPSKKQNSMFEYITNISLVYTRGNQMASSRFLVSLDYTVLTGVFNDSNIYCTATTGYVPRDEICDEYVDRVVCPSNTPDGVYTGPGLNPNTKALGKRQGYTWYNDCPRGMYVTTPSYHNTLDDGAIAGIVVGIIIFIAFLVVVALICRRRSVTVVRSTCPPTVSYRGPQVNPPYSTTSIVQTGGATHGPQQAYPVVPGGPPPYGLAYRSSAPTGYPAMGQSYGSPPAPNAEAAFDAPKF